MEYTELFLDVACWAMKQQVYDQLNIITETVSGLNWADNSNPITQ